MALQRTLSRLLTYSGVRNNVRYLKTAVVLFRRAAPLGPMPNEDIDWKNLESLEKYRSYTRYLKIAEEANNKKVWWKTYRQYTEEVSDPDFKPVNIGLPYFRPSRKTEARERRKTIKENKKNPELERNARLGTFRISLNQVKEEWEKTNGPYHIQRLADHYGIYRDLFPMAYFVPRVMLRVAYGESSRAMVHHGNHLTPTQASVAPHVSFEAEENSLWTLLLTSPDEHLQDSEQEYLHWLVGNIPGNSIQAGQEICKYIAPFPLKGTGFHRYAFILFKQEMTVDFSSDLRQSPCSSIQQRSFKTLDFYRKHQDLIIPAGLAFFQSQWDNSVTNTFHTLLRYCLSLNLVVFDPLSHTGQVCPSYQHAFQLVLYAQRMKGSKFLLRWYQASLINDFGNMREPVFEYDRPPVYHPPQQKYPHGQPLRYMDRYRGEKQHSYGIY